MLPLHGETVRSHPLRAQQGTPIPRARYDYRQRDKLAGHCSHAAGRISHPRYERFNLSARIVAPETRSTHPRAASRTVRAGSGTQAERRGNRDRASNQGHSARNRVTPRWTACASRACRRGGAAAGAWQRGGCWCRRRAAETVAACGAHKRAATTARPRRATGCVTPPARFFATAGGDFGCGALRGCARLQEGGPLTMTSLVHLHLLLPPLQRPRGPAGDEQEPPARHGGGGAQGPRRRQ
jgi:hypothetical protein